MTHYYDSEQVRLPRFGCDPQEAQKLLETLPPATSDPQVALMCRAVNNSNHAYVKELVNVISKRGYSVILMVGWSDELFEQVDFFGSLKNINVIKYVRNQHG